MGISLCTPLHVAAAIYADALDALFATGEDADALSKGGYSPLMLAAEAGNVAAVRLLLAQNVNPRRRCRHGFSVVHSAIMGRSDAACVAVLEELLLFSRGADPQLVQGIHGLGGRVNNKASPFHLACRRHFARTVEFIFARGVVRATELGNALHNALDSVPPYIPASGDLPATLEVLLRHGAAPNAIKYQGKTPMHFLAGAGVGWASRASIQVALVVAVLVAASADVNRRDDTGFTPLMAVCDMMANGNGITGECVRVLLAHGADPNDRTPTSAAPAVGGGAP